MKGVKKHKVFLNVRFTVLLMACVMLLSAGLFSAGCSKDDGPPAGTQFTVTFDAGEGTVSSEKKTYTVGERFSFPIPSYVGYDFVGWFYDKELTQKAEADALKIESDITLYAKYEKATYTIFFDTRNSATTIPNMTFQLGDTVSLPTPSPIVINGKSYAFDHWEDMTNNGSAMPTTFTVSAYYANDMSLYAIYDFGLSSTSWGLDEEGNYVSQKANAIATVKDYDMAYGTIEVDVIWKTSVITSGLGVIFNADIPADASGLEGGEYYYTHMNPTNGGMQLAYVNNSYTSLNIVALDANKTGFAEKLTAAKETNGVLETHYKIEYAPGLVTWYVDGSPVMSVKTETVSKGVGTGFRTTSAGVMFKNLTVTPTHYQVNFNTMGGLEVDPGRVACDETFDELPVPEYPGYEFIGWYTDETYETQFTDSSVVEGNMTVYAKWEPMEGGALISFDAGNGESFTNMYAETGAAVGTLPVPVWAGFDFEGWYYTAGGEEIAVNEQTVLNEDSEECMLVTLRAKWSANDIQGATAAKLRTYIGSYATYTSSIDASDFYGYVGWEANKNSFGVFDDLALDEGVYSIYMHMGSGANGLVFGADIQDDFIHASDYICAGSSYYYLHINNTTGGISLAKVTDAYEALWTSSSGWATGSLTGKPFIAGGYYKLSVALDGIAGARRIRIYIDDTLIYTYVDEKPLFGTQIGLRNAGGYAGYYGLHVTDAENIADNAVVLTLNNGGTVITHSRPDGWRWSLPAVQDPNGKIFLGWSVKDPDSFEGPSDLFTEEYADAASDGLTLYAIFVSESTLFIRLDAAGGDAGMSYILTESGTALGELPVPVRYGYIFEGWCDAEGNICTSESVFEEDTVLTAQWAQDASAILFAHEYNNYVATPTAYGYDIVSNYFGTLSNMEQYGAVTMDITFSVLGSSASDTFGIVFGATIGEDFPQSGFIWRSENTSYYYFAIDSNGGWTLYKMVGTNQNYTIKSGTWLQSYGEALTTGKTYSFRVAFTQVRNSEQKEFAVWVDGKPFTQGLDNGAAFGGAALSGSAWGVRNVGFRCSIASIGNSEVVIDRISASGGSVRTYLAAQDGYQTVSSAFSLFNVKNAYGTLTADIYLQDTMTGHFGIVCGATIADDFPGSGVWQSPNSTYYYICFNGKDNTWSIVKVSGSARTTVASDSEWIQSASENWKTDGVRLAVAYTEGAIVVSIDGSVVLEYTDAEPYTGSEWGISSVSGKDYSFTISDIGFEKTSDGAENV